MRKPDPLPAARHGFCARCSGFDLELQLVDPAGRYRCRECAVAEMRGDPPPASKGSP